MTAVASISALVVTAGLPQRASARREPGLAEGTAAAPTPTAPSVAPVPVAAAVAAPAAVTAAPSVATVPAATVPPPVVVAATAPTCCAAPPAPTTSLREARGMIVGGAVMFTLVYGFTALGGAVAIDRARKSRPPGSPAPHAGREAYGRALLVPLVGPFLAMPRTHSATDRWLDAAAGVLQLGGAVFTLVGVAQARRIRMFERFRMSAGMQAGGAQLSFSGRF
ncbi:MAG: hypothetical protein IPH07_13255 [Deltaproteobacteria bacterium]|nr:hypothetical protein [Deltaproteobacteria bacterium]MBK8241121.1 hypothetical protein [Deltaproteobacteria bacterium]MBK8716956.1 hypothetical protein [Deltaproteobacteria bacterium]MBP7291273.1 hypothetical protein [Nannocystaceae bacterium]